MRFSQTPQIGKIYESTWPEKGCKVKIIRVEKSINPRHNSDHFKVEVVECSSNRWRNKPQYLSYIHFPEFQHLERKNFWYDEEEEDSDYTQEEYDDTPQF